MDKSCQGNFQKNRVDSIFKNNHGNEKKELISTELEEKLTEIGRTVRDLVLIKVKHSPGVLVGLIDVHFDQATRDIDLSNMKVDIDLNNKKSLLYMENWPEEIEKEKILFIPK